MKAFSYEIYNYTYTILFIYFIVVPTLNNKEGFN